MRTTISIDDDLLLAAKALATQRKVSVGKIISELMRKGLSAETQGLAIADEFTSLYMDEIKALCEG